MSPQPCAYCQIPVRVRRVTPGESVFCCTGCAIAFRVPVDAQGQFPVNGPLVAALSLAFLLFNQAMFALMHGLLSLQSKVAVAERFGWLSLASGAVIWAAMAIVQVRWIQALTKPLEASLLLLSLAAHLAVRALPGPLLTYHLALNALLFVWVSRGYWFRRKK